MDWQELFTMQRQLDQYIEENNEIPTDQNLFEDKCLALLVELGELANETRSFKFWSTKPPSADEVILEEYVDGVHFILSLGIEKGFEYSGLEEVNQTEVHITAQFNTVFKSCILFKEEPTQVNYNTLFTDFLYVGQLLGFNATDIQRAYYQKNEVNYDRQKEGY
ncbi:MAG TPA: dUTP diphosphatase [Virgibacillus sp.]|nr:dUTP diphosphatase [Virgibacillus sp.]